MTQGLLGAVTAQLGFRQRIGRDASWLAFFAASSPDLDIVVPRLLAAAGADVSALPSWLAHRGLSHSVLFAPVLALPMAVAWWWARGVLGRRERLNVEHKTTDKPPPTFLLLYLCLFVAVLSHAPLDWCTSYGTQILSPLTDSRYAADAIGIIDIIYTPILILTLLTCYVIRKVGTRPHRATLIVAWVGLALSIGYIAAGRLGHDRAVAVARRFVGNEKVLQADAFPAVGTIFLWRAVVETEGRWHVLRVHHLVPPGDEIRRSSSAPKLSRSRWADAAAKLRPVRAFEWFCRARMRAELRRLDGLHIVTFHDMRYGWPLESIHGMWAIEATLDEAGSPVRVQRIRRYPGGRRGRFIEEYWDDLWNP